MKSSPMLKNSLNLSKDDSSSLINNHHMKAKRYQTMRSSDISKSMNNKHLQSTEIIQQMKQNAKASVRAHQKKLSLHSQKQAQKNNSISVSGGAQHHMFIRECDDGRSKERMNDQYSKVISVKEREMNTRTFSGPIVYK